MYRMTFLTITNFLCYLYSTDGTGEFLDAWLMLIEKMVNPKTVMESTHTLPEKSSQPGYVPFNKVQYIISTQKVEDNGYVSLNIS